MGGNRYLMLEKNDKYKIRIEKGGFYILILIGTIAIILAALIILSENSLKS